MSCSCRIHSLPVQTVKFLLDELKGDDHESLIKEEILIKAIDDRKKEDKIVKEVLSEIGVEINCSSEVIRAILRNLTKNGVVDKMAVINEIKCQNESENMINQLCDNHGIKKEISRKFVNKRVKEGKALVVEEIIKEIHDDCKDDVSNVLDIKSKELAEVCKTSVEIAKEVLKASKDDELLALETLSHCPEKRLEMKEAFCITLEEVDKCLQDSNKDFDVATQTLFEKMETEAQSDPALVENLEGTRSKSPDLLSNNNYEEVDVNDLHKEEESMTKAQNKTSQKASKDVPKKAMIAPLDMPSRRGRGVPEDALKKNSAQISGNSVTPTDAEPLKIKTKEELVAERKQKLKEIEARKEKKTVEIKKDSSTTGVMKNSVSRAQKLLATFQVFKQLLILKDSNRNDSSYL